MQCLTIVDEFTKFIFIIPVKKLKAGTTAEAVVKNVFLQDLRNRRKKTSTPYHSQGNAIAERVNSVVLNLLGVLPTNQMKLWHTYADLAAYCYYTYVHSSTGYSPFFMWFGRKPLLVGDALLNINLADSIPNTSFSR